MSEQQNVSTSAAITVKVGGTEVDAAYLIAMSVDRDLGQPDMGLVTLRNEDHRYSSSISLGDPVEISSGDDNKVVFKGEVAGLEPHYRSSGENVLVVRAFNRLHRLLRGRKSKTYVKQSDKDIVGAVAGEHGLSPNCGDKANSPKHEHVYQHNQTDLEFLRLRAARLGYEVWVDDQSLYFDAPDPGSDSGIKLQYGDAETSRNAGAIAIESLAVRMSSAKVLEQVTVRGWNPEKKEEIVGEAKAKSSKLGKTAAHSATKKAFSNMATFEVDYPIFSVEEAKAIAEARLTEGNMTYMTADVVCHGSPDIVPGVVVSVMVNPDDQGDRFNGKYMVVGVNHSYRPGDGGGRGGYKTAARLARDAEGG